MTIGIFGTLLMKSFMWKKEMQEDFLQGRVRLGFPREVRIFNTEAAVLPARNLPAMLHKMET